MQPVPINVIKQFAKVFAYQRKGFALKAITPFFEKYQSGLPVHGFDGGAPLKGHFFVEVVSSLSPRNQRYALFDLCCNPPDLKDCPAEQARKELLASLLASDGLTPLTFELSNITVRGGPGPVVDCQFKAGSESLRRSDSRPDSC